MHFCQDDETNNYATANTMTFVSYFVFVDAEKIQIFPVKMDVLWQGISAGCLEPFLKTLCK